MLPFIRAHRCPNTCLKVHFKICSIESVSRFRFCSHRFSISILNIRSCFKKSHVSPEAWLALLTIFSKRDERIKLRYVCFWRWHIRQYNEKQFCKRFLNSCQKEAWQNASRYDRLFFFSFSRDEVFSEQKKDVQRRRGLSFRKKQIVWNTIRLLLIMEGFYILCFTSGHHSVRGKEY